MRLDTEQPRRIREHGPRVGLGESLALDDVEEDLGVAARHVGVCFALRGA